MGPDPQWEMGSFGGKYSGVLVVDVLSVIHKGQHVQCSLSLPVL